MSADSESTTSNNTKMIHFLHLHLLSVKPASNKLGILEEDDEFEEFPVEGELFLKFKLILICIFL